jgi:beta-galactosidase
VRLLALFLAGSASAQDGEAAPVEPPSAPGVPAVAAGVAVRNDAAGSQLLVDGQPYFVRGMNWGYSPIGTNYRYSLWVQDDAFIEAVLRREMPLLRAMGVNAIRQYDDIPPRWVTYIFETYGIRTMINPLFGRYGLEVEGRWVKDVDYSNAAHRAAIKAAALASVERFKSTPGVLLWLLGNENNYGLSWSSFEIEALPVGERDVARATYLYTLFGEVVDAIHAVDTTHPVAIANGDVQYIDLVAKHVPNLDVFGTNVYRGATARDLYAVVKEKLGIPVLYTEFGADAFDARQNREDGLTQARYLLSQWQDVYVHTYGQPEGNAIGGFVFQWDDGWWKYKQDENLEVHDTHASWGNGGYVEDFAAGRNNMNEEWFGINAKGPSDADGHYRLYPRPAYYALGAAWQLDPYTPGLATVGIRDHFSAIEPAVWLPTYEAAIATGEASRLTRAYVRDLRVDLWTFTSQDTRSADVPSFDHQEMAVIDLGVRPVAGLEAHAAVSVLGNVASNQIDEISYETRGRDLATSDGTDLSALERVRLYQMGATWDMPSFRLSAYHRTGHFHWGYQGDLFGLYREANYGDAIDTYNADAPSGMEFEGKEALEGLAFAFGPQVYWGANPTAIGRYRFDTGPLVWTVMHQEDIAPQVDPSRTRAIPQPVGRKSTIVMQGEAGPLSWDLGGVVAGTERIGDTFLEVVPAAEGQSYAGSGYHVLSDEVRWYDTLGGKARLSLEVGRVHAYVLGTYRGLVADTGPDAVTTFTGWSLKDHGVGNVVGGLAGVAIDLGDLQVAPNVLVQRPLVGPMPVVDPGWDATTGWYTPGLTPRNIVDDPFSVSDNRETIAGELLLVYDPTPGTWFWAWDNAAQEDAPFAASLDVVYRHQPTSRDATLGFTEDGTLFTFTAAPAAADVWDATLRVIAAPGRDVRVLGTVYAGQVQSTGDDDRLVTRFGAEATVWWRATALKLVGRVNDYGPYDYYRTFNLTYPLQGAVDLSTGLGGFRLPFPGTRLGVRVKGRTVDEYSPDALTLGSVGSAFEAATYLSVRL